MKNGKTKKIVLVVLMMSLFILGGMSAFASSCNHRWENTGTTIRHHYETNNFVQTVDGKEFNRTCNETYIFTLKKYKCWFCGETKTGTGTLTSEYHSSVVCPDRP